MDSGAILAIASPFTVISINSPAAARRRTTSHATVVAVA